MNFLTAEIVYRKHYLPWIVRDGEKWVGANAVFAPLGLKNRDAVRMIIRRHKEDFGPGEAQLLTAATPGGPQQQWFLSRDGAEAVAFLAQTPEGREFRRWARKNWQEWRAGGTPVSGVDTSGAREPLSTQARRVLDLIEAHAEPGGAVMKMIAGLRDGRIPLQGDALLSRPLEKWEGAQSVFAEATRMFSEIKAEVKALGYTEEEFKAIVRWHRKTKESVHLPMLPGFDGAGAADA